MWRGDGAKSNGLEEYSIVQAPGISSEAPSVLPIKPQGKVLNVILSLKVRVLGYQILTTKDTAIFYC